MFRTQSTAALLLIASPLLCFAISIQDAINQRPELSTLGAISTRFPSVLGDLTTQGGTLLAPNNDALTQYLNDAGVADIGSISEASAREVVSYHSLPLSLRSTDLSKEGGALVDTKLLSDTFANLAGQPNVVYASAFGSTGQEQAPTDLRIFSGIGTPANVTQSDVAFDDGFMHVIDRVLNFPQPCTKTAQVAQLNTLFEALQKTNLTTTVDTTPKFTCFAPTDAAFQSAGVDVKALTTTQVADALKYHSIVGDVAYSTAVEDGKDYQTLLGVPVTVHKRDGKLFINDVAVERGNVIMSNGVAHVLSGVLSPPTTTSPATTGGSSTAKVQSTVTPNSSGTSQASNNNSAVHLAGGAIFGVLGSLIIAVTSGYLSL
ncbi:hypothetical protein D9611_013647 [Ephemerocybe angulata]|uniref:FAS1 domain-containing protein n=1 Tax=Ephemerocybe angulata TaxID=980116 RepID=A0A8H5F0N4_9AGAR|nr:hypothetical protein D9611_013647 [Tulosesus angulatus]